MYNINSSNSRSGSQSRGRTYNSGNSKNIAVMEVVIEAAVVEEILCNQVALDSNTFSEVP